jgi:hypothetical protein
MIRRITTVPAALVVILLLAACGGQTTPEATPTTGSAQGESAQPAATVTTASGGADATPTTGSAQGGATMTTQGSYPKTGHAPDYSWIAGRITFTRIQGGCIFILIDPAAVQTAVTTPEASGTAISGPFVGTAVAADTSPPLRDITPESGPPATPVPGDRFVPGGPAWDPNTVKDGEYVVLFGRQAGPGDAQEMCGGAPTYVADKMERNP